MLLGLFVFGVIAGGVWFVLWQSKYAAEGAFDYYRINARESVAGLNERAPVKLQGVNVGEVDRLFINPENSEEVSIVVKIQANTPIKTDTYAQIKPQGITGLSYLQLGGGTQEAPRLKTGPKSKQMGLIESRPSLLSRMDESLESVVVKVEAILEQTLDMLEKSQPLVREDNINHINHLLENSARASVSVAELAERLNAQGANVDTLMKHAIEMEKRMIETAKTFNALAQTLDRVVTQEGAFALHRVQEAAHSVESTMGHMRNKLEAGQFDVASIVEKELAPAMASLYEFEVLMKQAQEFMNQLEEGPADLLYRTAPQNLGPGERP
jgi:phospholipid/cholesterol/gamma-HCH transport system substrate-binding protein